MIRLNIEALAGGDENRKRVLGSVEIMNDTTGDSELGNYVVLYKDESGHLLSAGVVKRHARSDGIAVLIRKSMESLSASY